MRICLLSDLHHELFPFKPPEVAADLVVLAGDIDCGVNSVRWAVEHCSAPVLMVLGNHEYYGGNAEHALSAIRFAAAGTNGYVRVLEQDVVEIDGVRFVGMTGWTDYALYGNPEESMGIAEQYMSDFELIQSSTTGGKLRASEVAEVCQTSRQWLEDVLAEPYAGKTVVITHHAPTPLSIAAWRRDSRDGLNPAYANDWAQEDFWRPESVQLWLHGHVHHASDYEVNGVRVVCNPRGYGNVLSGQWSINGFNPELVLNF